MLHLMGRGAGYRLSQADSADLLRRMHPYGPAVVMRGRQEANDYYKILLAEMQERVAQGVAAVSGERFRFYWEGMPIWVNCAT